MRFRVVVCLLVLVSAGLILLPTPAHATITAGGLRQCRSPNKLLCNKKTIQLFCTTIDNNLICAQSEGVQPNLPLLVNAVRLNRPSVHS